MRWGWIVLVAACGASAPPPAHPPPAPSEPDGAVAESTCLTMRDQELACEHHCASIEPVLRTCATPGADGRIDVRYGWDGTRTEVELDIEGEGLERPAACVRAAFERFVPCQDDGPSEGTVPLRFAGG